jgi:hypothetical protein
VGLSGPSLVQLLVTLDTEGSHREVASAIVEPDAAESRHRSRNVFDDPPEKAQRLSAGEWTKFTGKSVFDKLYFDWTVVDE